MLAAHVADVGAAVVGGVGVHDFAVVAGLRNAEAVTFADDGRSVDNGNDEVFGFFAAANEGKNAVIGVVGVDPFETVPIKLDLVEGGFAGVKAVEIADEALDPAMGVVLKQVPVKAARFAPFVTLSEFLAHEEQFLAWMSALIGAEQTQIGELLPHITGHFVKKGVFPVDNFVVGEGKQEVLGEGVEQGKSELVVLIFAMNGIVGKVF